MARAKVGIVVKPDGTISGRVRSGNLASNEVVCISAANMQTAKAFVKSKGFTIKESEARGSISHGTQNYCFYLGKKRGR